jgi:MHS family proline/betaine transporter-like MFS transporter
MPPPPQVEDDHEDDTTSSQQQQQKQQKQQACGGGGGSKAPLPPRYGADNLTPRQFALIQLALVIGSSIEWFDFSVYGALSGVITPLFFPTTAGSSTSALYFWGVFALSFVTRPIGSLLLGSVGDRWGRRPALLISLAGMAVPTVLIGCLPTYQMIGEAAPILLALLRAIQGLAMGAEFSAAMVYSVELAPPEKKGRFGSLTFQAGILGIALGNAAVMVLTAFLSPEQMRLWGWRLPFLLTAFSALGAFALRMHMPEPRAWEAACEEGEGCSEESDKAQGLPVSDVAAAQKEEETTAQHHRNSLRLRRNKKPKTPRHTAGVPALKLLRHSWPQVLLQTLFEAFGSVAFYVFAMWLPSWHQSSGLMNSEVASGVTIAALGFMAVVSLFGGWASDACAAPRRRLLAASAAIAAGTAAVVPGFLGVAQRTAAAVAAAGPLAGAQASAALFQVGLLALAGFALGIVPSLCAELYKPDVRVVSFSLAHNLSMSLLGGTAPLIISAMANTAAGRSGAAPGVYVAAAGGASLLAAAVLARWAKGLFVAAASSSSTATAVAVSVAADAVAGRRKGEEDEAPPPVAAAYV